MVKSPKEFIKLFLKISPSQLIILSFLFLIVGGGFLLTLPISSATGGRTCMLDAFFTSTSAVCVTGLAVRDTGTYWSSFGKFVIIMLIQAGGLGFLTITTIGAMLIGKKLNLKTRLLMQEAWGQNRLQGIIKFTRAIFLFTVGVEFLGALLLSIVFIPEYGLKKGVLYAFFHAISAFCNAGFDLSGEFRSLSLYRMNVVMNITIMLLIIVGGLGFTVPFDVWKNRKVSRFSLHTKIVLFTNTILLLVGFVLFFLFEYTNSATLLHEGIGTKVLAAAFQSVTCRTAGFNTIDLAQMTNSSKLLTIFLMFVGGSPASTAGGIKTTTLAILFLITRAVIQNKKEIEAFHRRISFKSVNKAITILVIAASASFIACMILATAESHQSFMNILFEVISAIGTVGLTLGITPSLTAVSKLTLMVIMFIGRVGTLTILIAFSEPEDKKYKYVEEKIMI